MAVTPVPDPAPTLPPLAPTSTTFRTDVNSFFGGLIQTFTTRINALATNVFSNATDAAASAQTANDALTGIGTAVTAAGNSATASANSANDSNTAKVAAQAAATAAGAAAGLPALVNDSFLQVSSGGVLSWLAKTAETVWAKTVGGTLQSPSFKFVDKGTVAASGTAAFLFSDGDTQRVQAAGALTVTVGGWQATGRRCELELQCVNFGGKTVTWPTLRWIIAGGGFTTVAGSNGVTFQASGTDYILLWTDDAGATIYAKVLR